jgi:hypothetical protein
MIGYSTFGGHLYLYICLSVGLTTVSTAEIISTVSNDRWLVNNELERMCNDRVVAYLKLYSDIWLQALLRKTKKPQSG